MICPECGSYQPDRAKFCGICGSGLSQDGLVESFLKDEPEHDIVIPRRRSLSFYFTVGLISLLALALLAGASYLVYRVVWGEEEPKPREVEIEDNNLDYMNIDVGFSLSYPDTWVLEEGLPAEDELAALSITLSSRKFMELRVYQIDPIISIGGIDAIKEELVLDATERIGTYGGEIDAVETTQPGNGQSGYSTEDPGSVAAESEDTDSADDFFRSTMVGDLPAFYTEFNANVMGEQTTFLLYYVVAGDYLFFFEGRAPFGEYDDIRPLFYSITRSLQWEEELEQTPDESQEVSTVPDACDNL